MSEQIGTPLIVSDTAIPIKTRRGRVTVAIWAVVAGKDLATPATSAESVAVWDTRTVTVQSSANGANWADIEGLVDIAADTVDQDLVGNLYYRIVGDDLSDIMATVIES